MGGERVLQDNAVITAPTGMLLQLYLLRTVFIQKESCFSPCGQVMLHLFCTALTGLLFTFIPTFILMKHSLTYLFWNFQLRNVDRHLQPHIPFSEAVTLVHAPKHV